MAVRVIIPARMHSTRLPRKMLVDIASKPMIQHVHERASQSGADSVLIATDHDEIKKAVEVFGATACLTDENHPSGTSRLAQAAELFDYADDDVVVNVQGDEPLIDSGLIDQVAQLLLDTPEAAVATLSEPMDNVSHVLGAHDVKVVTDKNGFALYFSRAAVPLYLNGFLHKTPSLPADFVYARHIGIYAYRVSFLKNYVNLEASPLEKLESLEQLRVLWHGKKIILDTACAPAGVAVDTLEDLERVRELLSSRA